MPDIKFSNKYPYTDFHELNLDWLIKEVKYWSTKVGKTIQSIELTGTVGLVDTYTISYSDGSTSTFDVTNGNGIASVAKTGTAGLVDTYTITFQDGSTTTFEIHNGTASIDPTLSLADYAADAKATGDAIRPIENVINDITDTITETSTEVTPQTVTKQPGYFWNGIASASSSYFYVHITGLVAGDIVKASTGTFDSYVQPTRFIDAYNGAVRDSGACVDGESYSYTVPANIDNIYVTCYSTYEAQMQFFVKRTTTTNTLVVVGSALMENPKAYKNNSVQSSDDYLNNYKQSLKKGIRLSYFANFSAFTSLSIGLTTTDIYSTGYIDYFYIDGTNIEMRRKNYANVTWAHGLTITDYIHVYITIDFGGAMTVKLTTNGSSFSQTNYFYLTEQYYPFAVIIGSGVSNNTLSFGDSDFQKRIIIFGDSYLSEGTTRWLYYLPAGTLDNLCLDGYPGETSGTSAIDRMTLFKLGSPKYAVWTLGMNDGSDVDDSTPSTSWMSNVQSFITDCENRNIVPILATIPSVPTINNRAKSAWVRSSGYRYIDFAAAVNSDNSGNWYTNMLSGDGIHPDVEGAKALCSRAMTDFPEILIPD